MWRNLCKQKVAWSNLFVCQELEVRDVLLILGWSFPMDPLNKEFVSLLQISGWRAKRAAMELCLDPGTVQSIPIRDVKPSMTVLKLFGRLLGEPCVTSKATRPNRSRLNPSWMRTRSGFSASFERFIPATAAPSGRNGELVESLAPPLGPRLVQATLSDLNRQRLESRPTSSKASKPSLRRRLGR